MSSLDDSKQKIQAQRHLGFTRAGTLIIHYASLPNILTTKMFYEQRRSVVLAENSIAKSQDLRLQSKLVASCSLNEL